MFVSLNTQLRLYINTKFTQTALCASTLRRFIIKLPHSAETQFLSIAFANESLCYFLLWNVARACN